MFNKHIPYYEVYSYKQDEYSDLSIAFLELNEGLVIKLADNNINSVNDLLMLSRNDLIQKEKLTDKEIGKIETVLKKLGNNHFKMATEKERDITNVDLSAWTQGSDISDREANDTYTNVDDSVVVNDTESDMGVYESGKDAKYMERLFCENPLIGNKKVSEKSLREINKMAKKCLDTVIETPSYKLPLNGHMAITIATINYAKKWDASDESKLTRFITMQFGYRDDSGNVWKVIGKSIEKAMTAKKRLFIVDSNGREFYETVLVHSFGPERAWDSVFDLLFDFLKNNLRWNYIREDPTIEKMVEILKRRFEGNTEDDDELIISSTEYRIRLGARRLIKYRPLYATKLFSHALEKMVACISGDDIASNLYIDQLIDEWYSRKIGRLAVEDKKQISKGGVVRGNREDTAFTYSRIRTSLLCKNGRVYVHIPAIRLQDENIKETEVRILRKLLWEKGYRYRKNYDKLPGRPDIAIPKYKIAIFCDGEFFHGKDWEVLKPRLAKGENGEFWINKISRNRVRDDEVNKALLFMGWTVIRFWGKDIKKNPEECIKVVEETIFDAQISSSL